MKCNSDNQIDTLSKETFWNELYVKYPLAMKSFCEWIDAYKKRVDWNHLFRNDHVRMDSEFIKFHDIPMAMQIGIWIEFVCERGGCNWEVDLFNMDWREDIETFLKEENNDLNAN